MLLTIKNLTLQAGAKTLLKDGKLVINEKDKIKEVISLLELSVCIPPIYENNIYYNEIDGDVLSYMDNSIEKIYKK